VCIGIYHISHACATSKQASLLCKTNKYFHINKNDTGYHKALSLSLSLMHEHNFTFLKMIFKLRSTIEQMPALVYLMKLPIFLQAL
jgi:hypothetical protein